MILVERHLPPAEDVEWEKRLNSLNEKGNTISFWPEMLNGRGKKKKAGICIGQKKESKEIYRSFR